VTRPHALSITDLALARRNRQDACNTWDARNTLMAPNERAVIWGSWMFWCYAVRAIEERASTCVLAHRSRP
jgi:hypothetical protein